MIVTVFRSRLLPGVRDEYVALVDRMVELAAAMPGYISHKGFFADDGERVTIVEFESRGGPARLANQSGTPRRPEARRAKSITRPITCRSARWSAKPNSTATRNASGRTARLLPSKPTALTARSASRHEIDRTHQLARSARSRHGKVHRARRRRRAAEDDQCRHRHDHPQAVPEDDQAHRAGQGPVLRAALQRRRQREPGLRAQQAGLSQGQDPGRRRQFRLRLERASTRPGR